MSLTGDNKIEFTQLRKMMDEVDDKLVADFLQRMDISLKISECKKKGHMPAVDKTREHAIISRLSEGLDDEMAEYVKVLYSTVFDLSRAHQMQAEQNDTELTEKIKALNASLTQNDTVFPQRASVACQGADGSYSQISCDRMFKRADIMYCLNYQGVFQAVSSGFCRFGIVPIENSAQGSLADIYNLLKENDVHIVRALNLSIRHAILAKKDIKIENVKEIYTYRHALAECSEYIKSLGDVKINVCENTAIAAKMAASSDSDCVAAISSPMCAPVYGLKIIGEDIQNSNDNFTRFICIEKGLRYYSGANKISICVTLPHRDGTLYDLTAKFAALGINITKIESRMIPNNDFECEFYIDFNADLLEPSVLSLLANIEMTSDRFSFLGCYSES